MTFFDAHNHFQDEWLAPHRARIVEELRQIGITRAVVNGTTERDWPEVSGLARQHDWILPSYGLHPWHCGARTEDWLNKLRRQLEADKNAPVGEVGLDRWILHRARKDDPRRMGASPGTFEDQVEVFVAQLRLAKQLNRAITVHCLDAFGKLLELLHTEPLPERGVLLHAYGGPTEMVHSFAKLGAYFSFNGSFLAERAATKRESFKLVPEHQLLVETDAPAMPLPEKLRRFPLPAGPNGAPVNNPAEIGTVYEGLADLRGVTVGQLSETVAANFMRLFGE